jgi:hypothetical protein
VPQRFQFSDDIGDLCLSPFSHVVASIDRVHAQRQQFSDLFKRKSQFLRMSDEPEAPDGIVSENAIPPRSSATAAAGVAAGASIQVAGLEPRSQPGFGNN